MDCPMCGLNCGDTCYRPNTPKPKIKAKVKKETKLQPVGLFRTPDSFKEIEEWIDGHSKEEKAHLYTAAIMTWNLACAINKKESE
jgi:hypothetical protein